MYVPVTPIASSASAGSSRVRSAQAVARVSSMPIAPPSARAQLWKTPFRSLQTSAATVFCPWVSDV